MKSVKTIIPALTFLLLSSPLMAQVKNYEADWKKVNELIEKKNLPTSAREEVKKIFLKAKKENQDAQQVKALVYLAALQQETRQDNLPQSIREIEAEIRNAKEPAASILNSLLAHLYWQWLQNHRYALYSRTNTVNFNKDDLATWTLEDLHTKIGSLFLQSLNSEAILKQQKLELYDALIVKGNVRALRPTLFDLLAHTALTYFKIDEPDLHRPASAFEISQDEAFAPASEFVSARFSTGDDLSFQRKALLLYQKLIGFHLSDAKPDALIDVDIERLQFVYQHSVAENKDSLYLQALRKMQQKGKAAAPASYLMAAWYEQKAQGYDPLKDTATRMYRKYAETILEQLVSDSTNKNETWGNSVDLLEQIRQPSLQIQLENVNLPAKPFRAFVQFRNMDRIYLKLVKNNLKLKQADEGRNPEQFLSALLNAEAMKTWEQPLPFTGDLQQHGVEVKVDALPAGEYYLLASAGPDFRKSSNSLLAKLFHVSAISCVNQNNIFFVLHRESGQPLAGARAMVYGEDFDYNRSRPKRTKKDNYITDRNGSFVVPSKTRQDETEYYIDLAYNGDSLSLDEPHYYFSFPKREVKLRRIFFFTDRAIYRPGQTVFFKGIAIENGSGRIAENYNTTIYLRNANYKIADSLKVSTNEFGSFNGKFVLPTSGLNGNYNILEADDRNSVGFSVEEYKRPGFHVDFDTLNTSYRVNEQITVSGKAKAYAGNSMQQSKLTYRVVRRPRLMYRWFSRWFPSAAPTEIAHGELTTDQDGTFNFAFDAIPDRTIDSTLNPVFDYVVNVDVTAANGETRSGTTSISAGYTSLFFEINLPEKLSVDSLGRLAVTTRNMNGAFIPSLVNVTLTKLLPEQRLIRKRYWQQPDVFLMSKEEYTKNFPHDEYRDETDYGSWAKGEIAFKKSDSTSYNGLLFREITRLEAGFYLAQFSTHDKEGREIKEERLLELVQPGERNFAKPEYLWAAMNPVSVEPGSTATIDLGSSAPNIFLINQVTKPQYAIRNDSTKAEHENNTTFRFFNLDKEKRGFAFTPTEADRGGIGVNFFFVRDNRFYTYNEVINVPWTNKQLSIEYASFREKTTPGTEEKWTIKIKGPQKDRIAAEVLASMYDASLDQFRMNNWSMPQIWPTLPVQHWKSGDNFRPVELDPYRYYSDRPTWYITKKYDVLSFADNGRPGLFPGGRIFRALAGGAAAEAAQAPPSDDFFDANFVGKTIQRRRTDTVNADKITTASPAKKENFLPRKNFNETAFFFPTFRTDSSGTIEFAVNLPDALTTWKLQLLAHTKDLAFGYSKKELVSQKQIMVQPNMPRFLRQGDHIEVAATIANLSDSERTGQVQLELFDATTNQSVDGWFINTFPNQFFTVAAGGSETVKFPIQVPFQFDKALRWRITARAGNFSDGEEDALPVLTNKVLVTETLPLPMKGSGAKNFSFDRLLQSGNSETLQTQRLTVEYTSNPAWYAVQALPYLSEKKSENAEAVFNRYYANAIAGMIVTSSPRITKVLEQWRTFDSSALMSSLDKNAELKSILLDETPWVLEAANEAQQKKNIALLFDAANLARGEQSAISSLQEMQGPNGGFVWFKGGADDRYITQYILSNVGRLSKMGISIKNLKTIYAAALPYLDKKIKADYDVLLKSKADLTKGLIGPLQVQYLYMRSFFPGEPIPAAVAEAYNFYKKQAQKFWMRQNKSGMAMIALACFRTGDNNTYDAILKSLTETSMYSEELGRYWKENSFGYSWNWWHAPIETQSLIIEAFSESGKNRAVVDELRTWLIKDKQTNNWRTSRATADACYALLLRGTEWLSNTPAVDIQMGGALVVSSRDTALRPEAGTGYVKKTIEGQAIKPSMGSISVSLTSQGSPSDLPGWGAVYWQYFEDQDKVTSAATPLRLNKKLSIEKNTDRGPLLEPVGEGTILHVGDRMKVRIELRVDRDMDYVHMKDMRASALEPVNVLSGYRWQGGLGYYQSTKDATTNFFFNSLRKGTYVFEYPLTVNQTGTFGNGITTIQCMYAPEFSAHSEGTTIRVE